MDGAAGGEEEEEGAKQEEVEAENEEEEVDVAADGGPLACFSGVCVCALPAKQGVVLLEASANELVEAAVVLVGGGILPARELWPLIAREELLGAAFEVVLELELAAELCVSEEADEVEDEPGDASSRMILASTGVAPACLCSCCCCCCCCCRRCF